MNFLSLWKWSEHIVESTLKILAYTKISERQKFMYNGHKHIFKCFSFAYLKVSEQLVFLHADLKFFMITWHLLQ